MSAPIVLWIEDEPKGLSWFATQLERAGCEILNPQNASEVIEQCRAMKRQPDSVILDLALPTGDSNLIPAKLQGREVGLWLLGYVRHTLKWNVRVAVLSANVTDSVERQLQEYGVAPEAIFSKPLVEPEPLLDWVLLREDDAENH